MTTEIDARLRELATVRGDILSGEQRVREGVLPLVLTEMAELLIEVGGEWTPDGRHIYTLTPDYVKCPLWTCVAHFDVDTAIGSNLNPQGSGLVQIRLNLRETMRAQKLSGLRRPGRPDDARPETLLPVASAGRVGTCERP
jgi:hypothetical protein